MQDEIEKTVDATAWTATLITIALLVVVFFLGWFCRTTTADHALIVAEAELYRAERLYYMEQRRLILQGNGERRLAYTKGEK